jgi:hypothetical protein
MRQYDIIVFGGVGHDLDIGRVHTAYVTNEPQADPPH